MSCTTTFGGYVKWMILKHFLPHVLLPLPLTHQSFSRNQAWENAALTKQPVSQQKLELSGIRAAGVQQRCEVGNAEKFMPDVSEHGQRPSTAVFYPQTCQILQHSQHDENETLNSAQSRARFKSTVYMVTDSETAQIPWLFPNCSRLQATETKYSPITVVSE